MNNNIHEGGDIQELLKSAEHHKTAIEELLEKVVADNKEYKKQTAIEELLEKVVADNKEYQKKIQELLKSAEHHKTAIEELLGKTGKSSLSDQVNIYRNAMDKLKKKCNLLEGIVQHLQRVNLYFAGQEGLDEKDNQGLHTPQQELTFQEAIKQLEEDKSKTTYKNEIYIITPTHYKERLEGVMQWLKTNGYPEINTMTINDVISDLTKQIDKTNKEIEEKTSQYVKLCKTIFEKKEPEKPNSNLSTTKKPNSNLSTTKKTKSNLLKQIR